MLTQFHHLATATNDLDRMVEFYRHVFELQPKEGFPKETPVGRVAFYDLGGVELQIVESGDVEASPAQAPAILLQQKLRLDHFTVMAQSAEAFEAITKRLVERGASAGSVTAFGPSSLLAYTDPDGHVMEVIYTP